MRAIILYDSVLGATQKYVNWLGEELGCSVKRFGKATDEELRTCDLIIIASGTYAGRMPLTGFLKRKWELIKDKRIVVLAVGIAPEAVGWSRRSYESIPAYIREKIKYFKLPGRIWFVNPAGEVRKENLKEVIEYVRSLG